MSVREESVPIKKEESSFSMGGGMQGAQQAEQAPGSQANSSQDGQDGQTGGGSPTGSQPATNNFGSNDYLPGSDSPQLGQVLPDQPELKVIRRKIPGFVGFANLPKQWHRKSIRRGFTFNLLVVSQKGLGKSTLINTLFNKDLDSVGESNQNALAEKLEGTSLEDGENGGENGGSSRNNGSGESNLHSSVKINAATTTIEENGVNLKLTVVDAPGFGDAIDNTDSWKPIVDEINLRFDQYLDSENRISRTFEEDNRIHACLYFIEPTAHFLKPLDIEFCKQIHEKCNLIPVIAKSDILTEEEITIFKRRIRRQLEEAQVQLFRPPQYNLDDEEAIQASQELYEKLPYAVVGSTDVVVSKDGRQVRGRSYPWGVIEVDNSKHCDFVYLRDLLVSQYLEELRERTNKVLYEKYRSEKLTRLGIKQDNSVFKEFDPDMRQKEEKQLHEAKLAKLEAEMKTVFHQKVSEKEKKLQKSEAELFSRHKEMKEKLTKQLKALEDKKRQLESSVNNQAPPSPAQPKKKGFLR
ncbi:ASB_HP2_G0031420.mRNA.1.CDS.1 [Saccharomyces cerevisiae]|nr:ASB_HP2_G0031420.mRNA.1.CDS.1 [Saccharomyces cerevisiae]CAI6462181.1 ASB_HP1_G0027190.mRNA.1.CDS.1 [Saccharomyces cerevisiae]CAI6609330.1 ASB_HP2_G0031420.mRNA.1.CDS.1 [Saccharomyces cerevisiae]